MCVSILRRCSGRCFECGRPGKRSDREYWCNDPKIGWKIWGTSARDAGPCANGYPLQDPNSNQVFAYEEHDRWGNVQFMPSSCDICQIIERQTKEAVEAYMNDSEPMAKRPKFDIPTKSPAPKQVDAVPKWETFGGPNPEKLLLQYGAKHGAIVHRSFTPEDWQLMQQEYQRLQNREVYFDNQRSFAPVTYLEYRRANPEQQSNMRQILEAEDEKMRQLRQDHFRGLVGDQNAVIHFPFFAYGSRGSY